MRSLKCSSFLWPRRALFLDPFPHRSTWFRYHSTAPQLDSKGRVVYYEAPESFRGTDLRIPFSNLLPDKRIVAGLQAAFPSVEFATYVQEQIIMAINRGWNAFVKDHTGTGKSFGLLLALLSKERKHPEKPAITSLMIVPHRDLAYQLLNWAERIHSHAPKMGTFDSCAQVVVRDADIPPEEQISRLKNNPPHILFGTPKGLLEIVTKDPTAIKLNQLSTIVVDEVDSLIETPPRHADKYLLLKLERKMNSHPTATSQILDQIYEPKRRPLNAKKSKAFGKEKQSHEGESDFTARPQLIMSSATFHVNDMFWARVQSGWFPRKDDRRLIKISGDKLQELALAVKPSLKTLASDTSGPRIEHHALVVSPHGTITNHPAARESQKADLAVSDAEAGLDLKRGGKPFRRETNDTLDLEVFERLQNEPLALQPHVLEAVSEVFALEVPRLALLVLQSQAPVQRVVHELRGLGVDAHSLDIHARGIGAAFVSEPAPDSDETLDSPTLLVATHGTIRGVDFPGLTHVFIVDLPEDDPLEMFMHAAGRVGRFGRRGKVITFVHERYQVRKPKKAISWKDQPLKLKSLFGRLGIRPIKLEHFP